MARPKDHAHHRELAMQAFDVVRKRGVDGLTMSKLASDLGINRSTLYWYFKNLAEIFDMVLEITFASLAESVAARVAPLDHPIDRLQAWLLQVQDYFEADTDLLPVLVQLWAVGNPGDPERVLERARKQVALLREMAVLDLELGQTNGVVAPCDAGAVIDLCMVVMDGCLVHRVSRSLQPAPVLELFFASTLEPLRVTAARASE